MAESLQTSSPADLGQVLLNEGDGNLRYEAERVMQQMSRDGLVALSTLEELFEPGEGVALSRIYRAFARM